MILLPKLLQQVLLNLTLPVGCVWAWGGCADQGLERAVCPLGLQS